MSDLSKSVIFPIGSKFESDNFIGTVWLNMLTGLDTSVPIGNVTFEPGCRNNWHKHPGGQILLVTGGKGWYQEDDKPAQELRLGDVVVIPANTKHWHGAVVHLAVEANAAAGSAEWLEPVTDEEYDKLKSQD